jgi:hypothetical protein
VAASAAVAAADRMQDGRGVLLLLLICWLLQCMESFIQTIAEALQQLHQYLLYCVCP